MDPQAMPPSRRRYRVRVLHEVVVVCKQVVDVVNGRADAILLCHGVCCLKTNPLNARGTLSDSDIANLEALQVNIESFGLTQQLTQPHLQLTRSF
ncbi:hypothetical protein A0H81_05041 [Grifola frondosa]|uniref:Uncharacterized protein n=1 Tax=Grifola frondosa TaxID=5627 RepID=A0A1C7MD05_GRIFR|nr:hypothetical protein A0H81_05041 [Grifola frondosa]